jgi:uncharacterized protein (TIGR02452 family)
MKRSAREAVARETVAVTERGTYTTAGGRSVDIALAIQKCLDDTRFFAPEDMEQLLQEGLARPGDNFTTAFEVVNETTLEGIGRLLAESGEPVLALNFASARNPGGGFLNGSQAQEESLARSSAL